MRSYLPTFLEFYKQLISDKQILNWTEDFLTLSFSFSEKFAFFQSLENVNPLFTEELKGDRISFNFIYGEDSFYDQDYFKFRKFIESEQEIKLIIRINKKKSFDLNSNEILFFKVEAFKKKFNFLDSDMLKFFNTYTKSDFINIYLPIIREEKNSYLKILPLEEFESESVSEISHEDLEKLNLSSTIREEYTKVPNQFPIPEIFKLGGAIEESIKDTFSLNLYYLVLYHIANKFNVNTFLFRGQKNLEISWSYDFSPQNVESLWKIYDFVYKIEKFVQDKLEISRNIFTIYQHNEGSIDSLDKQVPVIFETIEQHFNIYISNQVKEFFSNKKDAIDEAQKYAVSAREAADKVVTNINSSMIAIITVILTTVVFLAKGDYIFFSIALILHIIYLVISYLFNSNFAKTKKSVLFSQYQKSSEQIPIVSKEEREKINTDFLSPALKEIDDNLKVYKSLTIGLVIFSAVLLILIIVLHNKFEPKKTDESPKIYIIHAQDNSHNVFL
ncbi:hypothetical protein CVD28_11475 [Bacillus sp. M6-12]|uniref:hypothetical protein n=1 Tax=Bacillus sp. M6-12 TaxID=2054166 RepID=UPI000C77DE6B|nr:hypothetical protein [Bacillus sp. M6-12]PLS17606.1 hypothetical protein CVD28_11475 [Bacillus sp. M6-12]